MATAVQVSPGISPSISSGKDFSRVSALMSDAVNDGVFPGAVLLVAHRGEIAFKQSFGFKSVPQNRDDKPSPMTDDTVFDIAALTSILVTTTILMKMVEDGQVKFQERVSRYLGGFGILGKSKVTIGHLLGHTSGLPYWVPFYEDLVRLNASSRVGILTSRGAREYVLSEICRMELKHEPGEKQVYSDLGCMLLGNIVELLSGLSLDRAAQRFVFLPLGLKTTSYVDLSMIRRRGIHPVKDLIAPTEECPWRKRILCGEVHDDNAWAMGGIAGHAGVFSTAQDLHLFTREMVAAIHGRSSFLKSSTVERFWAGPENEGDTNWRYGWDSPSRENGLIESKLSPQSVGFCGFTGCSVWIEPSQELEIILMSNRIHPSRSNRKIREFRPAIHDAVLGVFS